MGLRYPVDIDAWRAWQARRHPLRRVRSALRRDTPATGATLLTGGPQPRVLVVLEAVKPALALSLLDPVADLSPSDVAVLTPDPAGVENLTGRSWSRREVDPVEADAVPPSVGVVLTDGFYLPLGRAVHDVVVDRGLVELVAQHGLVTPLAPPLPPGSTLLAWSEEDARYWTAGRTDVEAVVVGSELFHRAAAQPSTVVVDRGARPVYLGQLHGAELPRRTLARAAEGFCVRTGARYRPHPSETDRLSRLTHARLVRRGVEIDRSGVPLREVDAPVVSVFSTGVLEAAARGIPAWVDLPDPPAWLVEFWERYGMARYGGEPTPTPVTPGVRPAEAAAAVVRDRLEGR